MKKTELILIGIAIIAMIMKFFHMPFSGVLTVLSFTFLSVIYMYFGFALFNNIRFRKIFKKETYKEISTKRIIGGVSAGFALSVSVVGIMFKFQSWPGASFNLYSGIAMLTVIAIISIIKMKKSRDKYYSNILKRIAFYGAISIFLVSIPLKTWLEWKYPNNPEYVKAVLEANSDPDNRKLWEKVDKEREKMQDEMNE